MQILIVVFKESHNAKEIFSPLLANARAKLSNEYNKLYAFQKLCAHKNIM